MHRRTTESRSNGDHAGQIEGLREEIEARIGLCPSFFMLARDTPVLARHIWEHAKISYFNSPLPGLFTERLFTYLSRFCSVRYCVARHCAFLLAHGVEPDGEPGSGTISIDDAVDLLDEAAPDADELERHLQVLDKAGGPVETWPEIGTELDRALHRMAVHVFLQPSRAEPQLTALRRVLGDAPMEWLMALLGFIRFAHFWTESHPGVPLEEDVQELIEQHDNLAGRLLDRQQAASVIMKLELDRLRQLEEHAEELREVNQALEREIRERKNAESELERSRQALEKLNESLEADVVRRTGQVRALSRALTLAEQRERRRLSEVLHDDLQQILFGLQMRLELLHSDLTSVDDDEASELCRQVDEVIALMARAVQVTRTLSVELNPPVLRGEGLGAALTWLASHMGEWHGLSVSLDLREDVELPHTEKRVLLVQIIRELLFNVVKHAEVNTATVRARVDGNDLLLAVEDKGCGFDPDAAAEPEHYSGGLGLFSVDERLQLFGGSSTVHSKLGEGTTIQIRLPLYS